MWHTLPNAPQNVSRFSHASILKQGHNRMQLILKLKQGILCFDSFELSLYLPGRAGAVVGASVVVGAEKELLQ